MMASSISTDPKPPKLLESDARQRSGNPLHTDPEPEMILQDQSKNYMPAKGFMLRKLGLLWSSLAVATTISKHRPPGPTWARQTAFCQVMSQSAIAGLVLKW
jgi:hypothetical protein